MYYNIETRKTVAENIMMGMYRRNLRYDHIPAETTYEEFKSMMMIQNGGCYIQIDENISHPSNAIRKYAKEMNVPVVGHFRLVRRAQHGLMNLWEDKVGNQFWQTPDGAITLNKVAMRAAFAHHMAE